MKYQALYRKYRSQTFDEIYGQDAIVQTLKNVFKSGKIAHAYLFSGPRGTGKTSIARLFAKALNCEEGLGHQCNNCENCKEITEGTNPDVIEIDAASNSGVDEVRSIIEKVKYAPIQSRYKVYIIDEVHMLSISAFNALLKTLEEPPSYVVFILCTTEPHKLLPTILSRCQRYEFSKINDQSLGKLLKTVLENENITYEDGVIENIVELANGGARDALSLLDQVIAFSGEYISLNDIEKVFGITNINEKISFLKLIKGKNINELLNKLDDFNHRNIDISRLIDELLMLLKDCLIYSKTRSSELLVYANEDQIKEINTIFSEQEIFEIIDLLMKCKNEIKNSSNPQFLFEIYILKLTSINEEAKQEIETPKEELNENTKTEDLVSEPKITDAQEEKNIVPESKPVENITYKELFSEGNEINFSEDDLIKIVSKGIKKDKIFMKTCFTNLVDSVDKEYYNYADLLQNSEICVITSQILLLTFDFASMVKKINLYENQDGFKYVIKKIIDRDVHIIAIDRPTWVETQKKYMNLAQVNKLPHVSDEELEKIFIN